MLGEFPGPVGNRDVNTSPDGALAGSATALLPSFGELSAMVDDKSKVKEDRKLVASNETYEVAAFAKKYRMLPSEAATIINRYGDLGRSWTHTWQAGKLLETSCFYFPRFRGRIGYLGG